MSYRVVVRPEVEADLSEAETWYEQQEPGLGRKFVGAAREMIDSLSASPLIHQVRSRRRQVRWAHLRAFPYRIVFRVSGEIVVIYAIIHSARHERNWKTRL